MRPVRDIGSLSEAGGGALQSADVLKIFKHVDILPSVKQDVFILVSLLTVVCRGGAGGP